MQICLECKDEALLERIVEELRERAPSWKRDESRAATRERFTVSGNAFPLLDELLNRYPELEASASDISDDEDRGPGWWSSDWYESVTRKDGTRGMQHISGSSCWV